ncbi:hypothetical protein H340_27676 [Streptomyces mobaraensis NBRC 13819 = DSM 40847]|nr:hypothetical protein H340_27676 [Streptomyces mobaraensis NBRC 13819 = DSM 40847]
MPVPSVQLGRIIADMNQKAAQQERFPRTMCEGVRCTRCMDRTMVREIHMGHDGTISRYDDWVCNCGYRRPSREQAGRPGARVG